MTKQEHLNRMIGDVADVIWWLKGYFAAKTEQTDICPFCCDHVEALYQARDLLKKEYNSLQDKE